MKTDGKNRPLVGIEQAAEMLKLLDAHRFATNDQIEQVVFRNARTRNGKPRLPRGAEHAANTALRELFDGGWVKRIPVFLPGQHPETVKQHYVNVLSAKGAQVITRMHQDGEYGEKRWRSTILPKPWSEQLHPFWLNQFIFTAQSACPGTAFQIEGWLDDRQLRDERQRGRYHFTTIPDGYFVVRHQQSGRVFPHFVEIDLGTGTNRRQTPDRRDWQRKVDGYLHYLNTRFRPEFDVGGMPVILTVTTNERRMEHLMAATDAAGGAGRFWFTTQSLLYPPPRARAEVSAMDMSDRAAYCAARQGLFWTSIWQVPSQDGFRSLATRCGA